MTDDEEDDFRIMVDLTDDQEQVRDGALAELLRKHGPIVKGTVQKQFGDQLAPGETTEILMRTATKACRYADRYDDSKAKLSTYLVAIALNEAKDLLAENAPEHELVEEDYLASLLSEDPLPDVKPTQQERKEIRDLKLVISGLPPLQRTIIKADLACNGTADGERLAEIHGTSKGSIYVSRNKAHAKIKVEMERLGHFTTQNVPG